jgi:hypothetical protein
MGRCNLQAQQERVLFFYKKKKSLCDKPESANSYLVSNTIMPTNADSSVMSVAISNYSKPQAAVHSALPKINSYVYLAEWLLSQFLTCTHTGSINI